MLRPAADTSQVDWLLRYSAKEPLVVQWYVSAGFAAYARVLNPANGFDGAPVRWSKIAQEVGVELTAETQWSDLAADLRDEGELINLDAPEWSPDPEDLGHTRGAPSLPSVCLHGPTALVRA